MTLAGDSDNAILGQLTGHQPAVLGSGNTISAEVARRSHGERLSVVYSRSESDFGRAHSAGAMLAVFRLRALTDALEERRQSRDGLHAPQSLGGSRLPRSLLYSSMYPQFMQTNAAMKCVPFRGEMPSLNTR